MHSRGMMIERKLTSIIIPTFNGASRIGKCLQALTEQAAKLAIEILVVDDGSHDATALRSVVEQYPLTRLIAQGNAGPAAARNRGALAARGDILLFTDDDCIPQPGWLDAMLAAFDGEDVVGAKGMYCSRQREIVARFVQMEYEDKYRMMAGLASIDFVDTYSAGFIRDRFLDMSGYDTSFPVACAEDIELSYRMSARGWKMVFVPGAIVQHTHPQTLSSYLKKKYKFAYWRVLAVRKNPSKGVKDSHTPQVMKLQLLLAPALVSAVAYDFALRPKVPVSAVVAGVFLLSTLPFAVRGCRKDFMVGLLSPMLLTARSVAQFLGLAGGLIYASRRHGRLMSRAR